MKNFQIIFYFAAKSKKKQNDFKHGNYRNYYYKRLAGGEQQTDFRLHLLAAHPELFRGKRVLDIGCNSGFITINFAKLLSPASVLGIDIDGSLIETARRELEKEKTAGADGKVLKNVIFRKVKFCHQNFSSNW